MGRRRDDEGSVIEYNEEDVDRLMMMEEKQCRVEGESNEILDLSIIQSLHKMNHTIINRRCFFTEESFKKVIDGERVVGRDSIPFQHQWMRVIDCHFFTARFGMYPAFPTKTLSLITLSMLALPTVFDN